MDKDEKNIAFSRQFVQRRREVVIGFVGVLTPDWTAFDLLPRVHNDNGSYWMLVEVVHEHLKAAFVKLGPAVTRRPKRDPLRRARITEHFFHAFLNASA